MRTTLIPILILAAMLCGCMNNKNIHTFKPSGIIYEHTRTPLMRNMDATEARKDKDGHKNIHSISVQGISAQWGDNAIGSIAKENGIDTILYADMEILHILIYTRSTLHVYGYSDTAE